MYIGKGSQIGVPPSLLGGAWIVFLDHRLDTSLRMFTNIEIDTLVGAKNVVEQGLCLLAYFKE